jgi:hypothetical protein
MGTVKVIRKFFAGYGNGRINQELPKRIVTDAGPATCERELHMPVCVGRNQHRSAAIVPELKPAGVTPVRGNELVTTAWAK